MKDNRIFNEISWYHPKRVLSKKEQIDLVDFLHKSLSQFTDTKAQIQKAIDYALMQVDSFGGFIGIIWDGEEIVGATVVNATGMDGYIPPYILVYIAVDESKRGQGMGQAIIMEIIRKVKCDIALHVEPHNPAVRLYKRMNFSNKYLEMRYQHHDQQ